MNASAGLPAAAYGEKPCTSICRTLRVLRRLIAIHLQIALIYRAELAMFALANLALPVVSLLIWRAAQLSGARLPVDRSYLATYFVLLGLVTMLTSSWFISSMANHIRLGDLSSWLVRPASTLLRYVANNLAEKALKSAVVLPVVAILWWAFRDSVRMPGDPPRWALFVVSVVLAATLVFAIDVMIGALAFWFDETVAIGRAKFTLAAVLSGQLVPLALMPSWSRGVMDVQPFRFTLSFPIEIVTGTLSRADLVAGFALQAGYAALACAGAVVIWRIGLRSYTAVGA